MRLNHLFDCAWRVAEISILREVNRAHAAAADSPHDFVATIQHSVLGELLYCGPVTAGRTFSLRSRSRAGRLNVVCKRTTKRV
jgi:hypothetical protein